MRPPRLSLSLLALALLGQVGFPAVLRAQVTVSQTTLAGFSVPQAIGGGYLTDTTYDQQTGQGADDFVGDGTNGYYGYYYAASQIDFGGGVENALVYRFRLNALDTSFSGNMRIGVDATMDGKIDLYFGISTGQGQTPVIVFQNPTGTAADANTSANTSALGTAYGQIATTAANYSYFQAPDGSQYYTNKVNQPNADAWLTFAMPFSTLRSTLQPLLGYNIDWDYTYLAFVAFSSTQGNAVNQDLYGIPKITSTNPATGAQWGDLAFNLGGGFTAYSSGSGRPVPEPAAFFQVGLLVCAGLGLHYWRHRRSH